MEMPSSRWNSQQLVGENSNFNSSIDHLEMDPLHLDTLLDDLTPEQYLLSLTPEGSFGKSSSPEGGYNASCLDQELVNNINEICDSFERPVKQMKRNTWTSTIPVAPKVITPSGFLISFGNVSSPIDDTRGSFEDLNQKNLDSNDIAGSAGQGTKRSTNNDAVARPPNAQDHVIAERNRRQRLTESFIALSALVPGLKKLDKATVLRDAIKYVKQLQERVELLEEEIKKKSEESSVVSPNSSKPPAASPHATSSCEENWDGCNSNKRVAEIEARVSEKNVLIRIHCEKQEGLIFKILTEIQKFNLSVVSSSVLPFGDYTMDITIVSQMEPEFSLRVEDLVTKLRSSLQQFP